MSTSELVSIKGVFSDPYVICNVRSFGNGCRHVNDEAKTYWCKCLLPAYLLQSGKVRFT